MNTNSTEKYHHFESGSVADTPLASLDEQIDDESVIKDAAAKAILPYLTLESLSDEEKLNIVKYGEKIVESFHANGIPIDTSLISEALEKTIVGQDDHRNDDLVAKRLDEAKVVFCATLLDAYNGEDHPERQSFYQAFFEKHPDYTSYKTLKSLMELLSIATRSGGANPCGNVLFQEFFTRNSSFDSDSNAFLDALKESNNPIEQFNLLSAFHLFGPSTPRMTRKILDAIKWTREDKTVAPLVKILAEEQENQIKKGLYAPIEKILAEEQENQTEKAPNYSRSFEHFSYTSFMENLQDRRAKQDELHREFPHLSADSELQLIAPGIAATMTAGERLGIISDQNGNTISISDYKKNNDLDLDKDSLDLLVAAHNPSMKSLIDKKLGLDLAAISLPAQVQLLKFMAKADNGRFSKLCSALSRTSEKLRLMLTENFVAADFGEDFGDALLDVVESKRLSESEKEKILESFSSCRESIGAITGLYSQLDDGEFAKEYSRAANERLTDAVTVFQWIAKDGIAKADLGWAKKAEFTYDSAIEALGYEARSLEIIKGTIEDIQNGKKGAFAEVVLSPDMEFQRLNRTLYNLYSPTYGHVLLYTRPEGSHSFDDKIEYGRERGRNAGVEASISFIVDPVAKRDEYGDIPLLSPYKPDPRIVGNDDLYDDIRMNKVSAIRIDREGRAPDWAPDDPRRDPINAEGMVSTDLAAIGDREDTPSGKIARLLSVGGKLREKIGGPMSSLNHNTKWFNQKKYGTSKGFSRVVGYIDNIAMKWCQEHGPKKKDKNSLRNKMRQERGSKTVKSVA